MRLKKILDLHATHAQFMLGADPEFEIFRENGVVRADSVVSHSVCAAIGTDGSGAQLELRPKPESSGRQLYLNILALVRQAVEKYEFIPLLSGHIYPLGCHIHFGGSTGWRASFSDELLPYLDEAYTELEALNGSARGNYAEPGAYEVKEHGFEYRSWPAGILAIPSVAIPLLDNVYQLGKAYYQGEDDSWKKVNLLKGVDMNALKLLSSLSARVKHYTFGGQCIRYQNDPLSNDTFASHVADALRKIAERYGVRFFGYKESRGEVSNIPQIAHHFGWNVIFPVELEEDVSIGLPYSFRVGASREDLESLEKIIGLYIRPQEKISWKDVMVWISEVEKQFS